VRMMSLFDGIAGFPLGFSRHGFIVDTVCEIDKAAAEVSRRHFPEARYIDDVRKVGKATHERKSIDIIVGGFPCQDVSVAGKRAGLAGKRSGLWFEFARVIDELEPGWVVIENVPGLLSSWGGNDPPSDLQEGQEWETTETSDFYEIVQWLSKRGYGVCWRVLDAQYFGVAQRRRRVFIVASFGNGRCAEVLFEREGLQRDTPPRREAGKGTTPAVVKGAAIGHKPEAEPQYGEVIDDGSCYTLNATEVHAVQFTNTMYETGQGFWQDGDIAGTLRAEGENRPSRPSNVVAFQQNMRDEVRLMGSEGDHAGALSVQPGMKQQTYVAFSTKDYGNGASEDLSPTVQSQHTGVGVAYGGNNTSGKIDIATACNAKGGTGRSDFESETFVANTAMVGVRRLTPTECERLQGFPDGWTDGQSDSARYRQLGNAVAVPVIEWLAKRIRDENLS
jgi:DNA (cytosine-5)-methyltransferase 1